MKPLLSVLLLALAGLAWWGLRAQDGRSERAVEPVTRTAAVERPTTEPRRVASESAAPRSVEPGVQQSTRAALAPQEGLNVLRVHGLLTLTDGTPAAGARVELVDALYASELVLPEEQRSPGSRYHLAVADAEGEVVFVLRERPRDGYALRARLEGRATRCWTVRQVPEQRDDLDFGRRKLAPGGVLRVQITASYPAAARDAWTVCAIPRGAQAQGGGLEIWETAEHAEDDGSYLLTGLADDVRVLACSRMGGVTDEVEAMVRPGEEEEVELTYVGPPLDRRLVVEPRLAGLRGVRRGFEYTMRLVRDGRVVAERPADGGCTELVLAFDDLDPGPYRLEIEGPGALPFAREGVEPGNVIVAELEGNAALRVLVRDAASGAPVERYRLLTRLTYARTRPPERELRAASAPPPADGLYRGVEPGKQILIVEAAGSPRTEVDLGELQPHETRDVTVDLVRDARMENARRR
ncbi:MAG: hypothetical protein H6828_13250 [Planctomycetes bacterium]|nr:hypothetical protein [Planctomycetota bacterium]